MMSSGYTKPSLTAGILEFNPQLAGQDITPANLEFGSTASRRRDRREKSLSGVSGFQVTQPSYNAAPRTSSFTAVADEFIPSTNQLHSLDPYQSSVEYRLQELTKRLTILETKLTEDVSSVLTILQRQFPPNSLASSSSAETLKASS
ncbi:unnamed protein product [Rotaria sp. Silwood2]|nr:unnamed protein product [Rotaria sp. Silwood2]CAF2721682.1 unnamed protein product [Rotaria sp. Silwood2]CAF2985195.1 unnamed protein product [Rotaria sp. Silwood2]CAF3141551.1 unnamed protein product [Rotaria sp. Silwood2]CAF3961723.1 unnamed protein product [Rotaria sp. Silwood2]